MARTNKIWLDRWGTLALYGVFILVITIGVLLFSIFDNPEQKNVDRPSQSQPAGACNYEGCREDENDDAQYEYYKTMRGEDGSP